ncbi:UNVERIFIED_CONTAM: hypothetical protein HDU68_000127 [Siphonaria sp. JEL0065]|nr:hypothetical protein HDU68_000127 [Siphonaria sp. JEL0065]
MLVSELPLGPDATMVLVNEDLLFEVDVAKKEVYPVYWYGPTFHVQRGTWFVSPDNGTKFIPCDDNLSKQLEDGYKKYKPWLISGSSPSGASATHLSSKDSPTKTDPPTASSTAPSPSAPEKPPLSYKPEQKWALFGPYMNSHVVYTDKSSALIVSDQLSSKLARAVMSQITRSSDSQTWGTKVWRGWDEVEKIIKKSAANAAPQKPDKRKGSVVSLESNPNSNSNSLGSGLDLSNGLAIPGGSDGQLSTKVSKESLSGGVEEEKWKDDENVTQDRQIDHLVLVIHGVGQKLGERVETVDFAKDCTVLRHALMQSSKLYFTAGAPASTPTASTSKDKAPSTSSRKPVLPSMPEHGGIQVLPVQWRQKIDFGKRREGKKKRAGLEGQSEEEKKAEEEDEALRKEQEVHIDEITLDGVQSIRYLVSDIVLDVLLYMTPKYRQEMVNHVVDEMNRIYDSYIQRNPHFNGRVSLYGHSLGSLLAFDILCNQTYQENEPLPQMSFQPPRMQSEMDLSDVINRMASNEKSEKRLNGLMERADIQYKTLNFKVDKFFAVGSPVGLFLLLKGDKLVGRPHNRPAGVPAFDSGISSPACNAVYNIFHPHDPVAYRFEPLAAKSLGKEKPVPIQYNKGGLRGTITGIADLSSGIMKSGFNMFSGLFQGSPNPAAGVMNLGGVPPSNASSTVPPNQSSPASSRKESKDKDDADKSKQESKEKVRDLAAQEMENVKSLNPRGRLDYVLQEGVLENPYLSSLSSHMTYWPDHDVAVFMLRELNS